MSQSAEEALKALGVDPLLIDLRDERRAKDGTKVDRRICICGHAVGRHRDGKDRQILRDGDQHSWACKPNARDCNCKRCIPVLKVSSPKYFLRVTDGAAETHALIRGIKNLTYAGGTFEWLVELICVFCGAEGSEHKVLPTPLTRDKRIKRVEGSDGYDGLVCEKCRNNEQLG